jgi:GNAT superfamily N-acetyltransferase
MNYQIKKTSHNEVEAVYQILVDCGQDMSARLNLTHWDPPIDIELLNWDAIKGNVYGVLDKKQTIATFTISITPLDYYTPDLWEHPEDKALHVSHLAVLPNLQNKGIGSWCMKRIEWLGEDWGCTAIRLDAHWKYESSLEFYDKLGYTRRKIIDYKDYKLVCFEKIL